MSANGHLKFQGTNRATFVGTTSNIMFDTTSTSLGIGVTGTDHPSSNLYVTGNAYVSSNIAVGGVLTMGTVNVVARHDLEAVTALGNTTPVTLEFTNPTTSLVASGNVVVTGNVTADHFVGDGSNITGISSTLQAITDSGPGANVTSNTVQFSNATTGFVTTANVEVGGELTVSGNVVVDTNTLFVDSVNNRVGVGTVSPSEKLHVEDRIALYGAATTAGVWYYGNNYDSDTGSQFIGRGGSSFPGVGVWVSGLGWKHHFRDTGNFGIGIISSASHTCTVNGSLFYYSGGLNGSDDRIKYNETDVDDALTTIDKLKPQKYEKIMTVPTDSKGTWIPTDEEWEDVKSAEEPPYDGFEYGDEYGFIAQDVRNIPELSFLVSGEETDADGTQTPLGLNYQGVFVVAVKAIQELKAKNEALEARIAALENA